MTARAFSKALTVKDLSARTMIKVIKIGGNIVDNPELLREFVKDFAAMPGMKVLVHGGGVMASQM